MSARRHTSAALSKIVAPAATYNSSPIALPSPAPRSTKTSCPPRTYSRTPEGTSPTRYSWFFTSLGTPMITMNSLQVKSHCLSMDDVRQQVWLCYPSGKSGRLAKTYRYTYHHAIVIHVIDAQITLNFEPFHTPKQIHRNLFPRRL